MLFRINDVIDNNTTTSVILYCRQKLPYLPRNAHENTPSNGELDVEFTILSGCVVNMFVVTMVSDLICCEFAKECQLR